MYERELKCKKCDFSMRQTANLPLNKVGRQLEEMWGWRFRVEHSYLTKHNLDLTETQWQRLNFDHIV